MMSLDPVKKSATFAVRSRFLSIVCVVLAMVCFTAGVQSQTLVSGSITGVITDPAGAAVANATVHVVSASDGSELSTTTNAQGHYTVPLLKPGKYKVNAEGQGLRTDTYDVEVPVGAVMNQNISMKPTSAAATVEVSSSAIPLIDVTTPAIVTTFNEEQFQQLPAPGGDISTIAYTAPGAVVNAGGMYGNFSIDGLPGISNLFVLNGADYNDPFLSLNNSGSSNLTLGQAEIEESSVMVNNYSTQYGRSAGAIVSYTTKSGSNAFHGLVNYYYNGNPLNANDWFRNLNGVGRERSVSNQWAVQAGGPIIKDKLFFFTDYEGLHYVLPASGLSVFPTPQLQSYILGNIPSPDLPFYNTAFSLFQAAPFYSKATATVNAPIVGGNPSPQNTLQDGNETLGCGEYGFSGTYTGTGHEYFGTVGDYPGTMVTDPAGVAVPCTNAAQASASNLNQEFLWTWRADWHINDKHSLFGRAKMDHGTQPTFTDFTAPAFNTISKQPEYEGQLNDTYQITPNMTNQFVFSALWYTAYFGPQDLTKTLATFPTFMAMFDGGPNEVGFGTLGMPSSFPQGRNVTGYQFEDDLSWIKGKHTLKFGANIKRDLISLYDAQTNVDGGSMGLILPDFANGYFTGNTPSGYSESFTNVGQVHLRLYNMGYYIQDDYQANSRLKLSAGIRIDRTANPGCQENCFTQYNAPFDADSPMVAGGAMGPYSAAFGGGHVSQGHYNAYPSLDPINFQPRGGFVWDIKGNGHTVFRGGVGLFTDLSPAVILDNIIQNFPNKFTASVVNSLVATSGTAVIPNQNAPGGTEVASAFPIQASEQNTAVQSGYTAGQNLQAIATNLYNNQNVVFPAPTFGAVTPSQVHNPSYIEWNVQIQQQIDRSNAVILGYVGNYGYNELFFNADVNAGYQYYNEFGGLDYENTQTCYDPNSGNNVACYPNGVNFLPAIGKDGNFSFMNKMTNAGRSNYNGLQLQWKHSDRRGLTLNAAYTWSHSLDMISNGGANGQEPFNFGSIAGAMTPYAPYTLNYSNSDYDVRNNFVFDALWQLPYKFHTVLGKALLQDWAVSAKSFYRSGEPFSLTDPGEQGSLGPSVGGTPSVQLVTPYKINCTYNPEKIVHNGCLQFNNYALDPELLTTSQYYYNAGYTASEDTNPTMTSLGNVRRNALFGPHYADTDLMVEKRFLAVGPASVVVGATAFNLFNHPNFSQPNGVIDGGAGSFGFIASAISPPTSPYGSFQGAAVTGRLVQVFAKVKF